MENKSLLMDLPKLPVQHVLEHLNYVDIQKVRKTCSQLRHFVDKSKIDFDVKSIKTNFKIGQKYHMPCLELSFTYQGEKKVELQYWHEGYSSCSILAEDSGVKINSGSMKEQDYFDSFMEDFSLLLGYVQAQKCPLDSIEMRGQTNCSPFLQKLESLCEVKKLKSKEILMDIEDEYDAGSILRCFDSESTKIVKIDHQETTSATLPLEELAQIKLWKNLEKLDVNFFEVQNMEPLWHLKEAKTPLEQITTEEILSLKNKFLSVDPPKFFELYVNGTIDGGEVGLENEIVRFFETPTPEKVLSMGLVANTLTLKTVDLAEMLEGVHIF